MIRPGANKDYARQMNELRRSNAAGIHKSKRNYDRNVEKRNLRRSLAAY